MIDLDALAQDIQRVDGSNTIDAGRLAEALMPFLSKASRDAERWNALLRCARIRMFGSAGFDPETGKRREYSNELGEFYDSSDGWVHFGAEFWSVYPGHEDADRANRWGTRALIALADDVLLKEREEAEHG